MATKADFTADEWKQLHQGVSGAGMLVSLADQDLSDSFGEANALAKYLAGEHVSGSTELIREICGVHSTGFGVFASPTKVRDETMAALADSVDALRTKAPDELEPYRKLVLGAAEAVAEAKGGVRAPEQAMIDAIAKAVGEG
jgi:hypothetical protein